MKLHIDQIRLDGGTQPRATIDDEVVQEYMERMAEGEQFPSVVVYHDGENYWLVDGFHRYRAVNNMDWTEIECEIRQGTLKDAQWYSYSANRVNGLHRSHDDIKRAVEGALAARADLSDKDIARHIGVHFHTVAGHRAKLGASMPNCNRCADTTTGAEPAAHHVQIGQDEAAANATSTRTVTRNGKIYQMKVDQIGRAKRGPKISRLAQKCRRAAGLPELPDSVVKVTASTVTMDLPTNHVENCAYALYHTFAWTYLEQVTAAILALKAQQERSN